jgi:uncharacterized RDD family membrane protein YckC
MSCAEDGRELRAGFWIRVAAHIIDALILIALGRILEAAVRPLTPPMLAMEVPLAISLIELVINVLYYVILTVKGGQTLGKKALGIKVVMLDGSGVTWGKSVRRWFGYILSTLPLCLGYLWVGLTKGKRAWHDLLAGTKVVYASPEAAARGEVYTPEDDKPGKIAIAVLCALGLLFAAAIVLIAAVAIPFLTRIQRGSEDFNTRGRLGSIRSALSIYYGDMEGQYPDDLASLTAGAKYLSSMPVAETGDIHPDSNRVRAYPSRSQASGADEGGWGYANDPSGADFGSIWVNCSHTDSKGTAWNSY